MAMVVSLPDGVEFEVQEGENLLEAALRANIPSRMPVVDGQNARLAGSGFRLTPEVKPSKAGIADSTSVVECISEVAGMDIDEA